MSKVYFDVDAYTARLIGRENVSRLEGAVSELVKNTYDADASCGGADKILDYADRPSFCLYSSGLSPPREILIRFSRYQTI